jgi:FMN phosphatase YigB (HAD superfamily)
MVGDDWKNDIAPAASLGIHTYWIAPDDAAPPQELVIQGRGSLDELVECIHNGWLERLGSPA